MHFGYLWGQYVSLLLTSFLSLSCYQSATLTLLFLRVLGSSKVVIITTKFSLQMKRKYDKRFRASHVNHAIVYFFMDFESLIELLYF